MISHLYIHLKHQLGGSKVGDTIWDAFIPEMRLGYKVKLTKCKLKMSTTELENQIMQINPLCT